MFGIADQLRAVQLGTRSDKHIRDGKIINAIITIVKIKFYFQKARLYHLGDLKRSDYIKG